MTEQKAVKGPAMAPHEAAGTVTGAQSLIKSLLIEELQDLRLDGYVERGHGLVGDQQLGLEHQRPGDSDPLPLSTRELVRVASERSIVEADMGQEGACLLPGPGIGRPVGDGTNGQDLADRRPRVQRGGRVLEHHLDLWAQAPEVLLGKPGDVDAFEDDLSGVALHQLEQEPPKGGLAGATLAHHAQRPSGGEIERDLVNRRHFAPRSEKRAAAPVRLQQALDLEDRFIRGDMKRRPVLARQMRNGRDEALRVGMTRRLEHLRRAPLLDDMALLHNDDAVSDFGCHPEIMRDENHAHVLATLNVADQLEDLGLGRHVQRGRRLVGDKDGRLERERHRDHHSLALPARKPEWILLVSERRARQTHFGQELEGATPSRVRRSNSVYRQDLVDLFADGHEGV